MDFYKKIIKNQRQRMKLLSLLRWIPDAWMLRIQYWIKFGRLLDLKSPKRFTEKIQWYKLNYKSDLMPICSDKYTVRKYVSEKGLSDILVELYGVYQSVDEIPVEELPQKFVMKLSNGSGGNFICRDKAGMDLDSIKDDFNYYRQKIKVNAGREWPYTKARSVIIVEELLEDNTHINNAVNDYKIFCYNGKPEYIICISDRYSDRCNHLVYDTEWNKIRVASEGARIDEEAPKPENLLKMLEIARKLSEDFPFARIDLYSVAGRVYFGEITFYPWSGYMEFEPDEFDFELGAKFELRKK